MKPGSVQLATLFLTLSMSCRVISQEADGVDNASPTLTVDASFVLVPTLVRSADGATVRNIAANQFQLWDDGVPQTVVPVNTGGLPISLVILMQTGGSARPYFPVYADLASALGWLVGDSVHEITFVTFDSHIRQIWHFPTRSDGVQYALMHEQPGDNGAAIRDAVHFAVRQLQAEPGRYRRIILLLSQSNGEGSSVSSRELAEELGMASTVVYSLILPGGEKRAKRGVHRERAPELEGTPPALNKAVRALDTDAAAELASLTGGSSVAFNDQESFNTGLFEIGADIRDAYTLGFQPTRLSPGLHTIRVAMNSSKLKATARSAYWCQPIPSITGSQH